MKSKRVLVFILVFAVLFAVFISGCQSKKINVYYITDISRDETGRVTVPEGSICLSVYGKDGQEIIKEAFVDSDYKKNISAADLSKDICRELNIPIVFSGAGTFAYVQGINNIFEFDNGAESGWLYSVNGEFQSVSCGSYVLKDGDYVEWHYTLDLGKDVGAFKIAETEKN